MLVIEVPIAEWMMDQAIGCSGCGEVAPFSLRDFEAGPVELGWQLRLLGTEAIELGHGPTRAWRWDLFCPACASESSPRPQAPHIRVKRRGRLQ